MGGPIERKSCHALLIYHFLQPPDQIPFRAIPESHGKRFIACSLFITFATSSAEKSGTFPLTPQNSVMPLTTLQLLNNSIPTSELPLELRRRTN